MAIDDIAADTQEGNTVGTQAEIGRNFETVAVRKATRTDLAFAEMPNGNAGQIRFTRIAVGVVVAPTNGIVNVHAHRSRWGNWRANTRKVALATRTVGKLTILAVLANGAGEAATKLAAIQTGVAASGMVAAISTALAQALLLGQFKANNRSRSIGIPNTTSARRYLAGGVYIGWAGSVIAKIFSAPQFAGLLRSQHAPRDTGVRFRKTARTTSDRPTVYKMAGRARRRTTAPCNTTVDRNFKAKPIRQTTGADLASTKVTQRHTRGSGKAGVVISHLVAPTNGIIDFRTRVGSRRANALDIRQFRAHADRHFAELAFRTVDG